MKTRVFQDNNAFSQSVPTHSEPLGCGRERRPVGAVRFRVPRFWQISEPYLNQDGADYAYHITTAEPPIFRPSYGPGTSYSVMDSGL